MPRLVTFVLGAILVTACGAAAPAVTEPPTVGAPTAGAPTPAPTAAPTSASTQPPSTPSGTLPPGVVEGGNSWGASAAQYVTELGQSARFICQPDGVEYAIWGTDIYTSDSSVCTAGVHVGLLTFDAGGEVIAELVAGQDAYVGSTQNGVTSRDYASYSTSFTIVGAAPLGSAPPAGSAPPPSFEGSAYDELLSHIDSAIASTCSEVDPTAAEALAVARCTPEDVILDPDLIVDDVVYVWYETLIEAEDRWAAEYEELGSPTGADCRTGPGIEPYTVADVSVGRVACADDVVFGGAVIAWWYDNRMNVVGSVLLAEGTYDDLMNIVGIAAVQP